MMNLPKIKLKRTEICIFAAPLQMSCREKAGGCPGVPVHEGIPFVFITIHGVMTQFVIVSFFCVPVHEDTTES